MKVFIKNKNYKFSVIYIISTSLFFNWNQKWSINFHRSLQSIRMKGKEAKLNIFHELDAASIGSRSIKLNVISILYTYVFLKYFLNHQYPRLLLLLLLL